MKSTNTAGPAMDRRSATPVRELLGPRLRELMQHTAIYGLGPVLGQVAAFLLLPLYTNLLSPADYGVLEIILLVGTFLNVFFGL